MHQETALPRVLIGNDLVVVHPPGSTTVICSDINTSVGSGRSTVYTKLKIDQNGEMSQWPQGYAIHHSHAAYTAGSTVRGNTGVFSRDHEATVPVPFKIVTPDTWPPNAVLVLTLNLIAIANVQ